MSDQESSQEEKEIQQTESEREKRLLACVRFYYSKKQEVKEFLTEDISIPEFKNYLLEHHFPELLDSEFNIIESRIEKRMTELNELEKKMKKRKAELDILKPIDKRQEKLKQAMVHERSETLGYLKSLLFIPSWSKLLGTDFRGFYLNKPVYEIIKDTVVLLPEMALSGHEKTLGEPFFFIFGPGIYSTSFRLSPGEIITDYREITGLLLPLSIYEKAQDISGSMISTTQNLRMTEYLISIPFSLIDAAQTSQMFMRGVVARNVIHPNREAYDSLVKTCQEEESFNIHEGFKILSGGLSTTIPLYTNEILTEKPIQRNNYSNLTAGIKNIQPKVQKIITDLKIGNMKEELFTKIDHIKKDFIKIGHPKLTDWIM